METVDKLALAVIHQKQTGWMNGHRHPSSLLCEYILLQQSVTFAEGFSVYLIAHAVELMESQ